MRTRTLGVAAVMTVAMTLGSATAQADVIRVQSTTDTVDAGLVEGLLRPAYQAAQPGDSLDYVGVGTGAALNNARQGLADVVITHAPSLEKQFVDDGFSLEARGRAIFYSDYVIVGPLDDPANVIANGHRNDAIGAFEDIAIAGQASPRRADFITRANNSGTSVQEQIMWGFTTNPPVLTEPAFDAGSDPSREEPGDGLPGTTPPGWYHRNPSGQASNLNTTSACPTATYASGKCYTILDRGTFNRLVNAGTVTNLKIVSEKNTATARGGPDLLINPFGVYILNPAKTYPNGVTPNVAAGRRFVDFLVSPSFQAAVDTFPTTTDPAFIADAYAKVTLTTPLPPTASAGSTVAINATLSNKLPGALQVSAMPVQLQRSTDGGATYTDVGGPVNTSATGTVSFTPTITATTRFRLSMPLHTTGGLAPPHAFSPNTQDIGIVSVPGASPPPPVPPPPPPPPPPPAADRTAPRVTEVELGPRTIAATISEAGTVRVTIAKRSTRALRRNGRVVRRNGRVVRRVTYRNVAIVTIRATRAGNISGRLPRRLSTGIYRVKLRANDAARNVSNRTLILRDLS